MAKFSKECWIRLVEDYLLRCKDPWEIERIQLKLQKLRKEQLYNERKKTL